MAIAKLFPLNSNAICDIKLLENVYNRSDTSLYYQIKLNPFMMEAVII